MEKIIQIQRKIVPEFIDVLEERYHILRTIYYSQPVGRRALALRLDKGERVVRAQVDFLRNMGMIVFSPLGMSITEEGCQILAQLEGYIKALRGLADMEIELAEKLQIARVIIIPGDSDVDDTVNREVGRASAKLLQEYIKQGMTIAVSGGSTMAHVAKNIDFTAPPSTLVVPARGGLGEEVEYQANNIAAVMAARLGSTYRQLYVPDGVSEEAMEVIVAENASIREVAQIIKKADILVQGIGQAEKMAVRRGLDKDSITKLVDRGAVGEALGQYCTLSGEVVFTTNSIGLMFSDVASIHAVIAVASGRAKAQAIVAVLRAVRQDVLIIDEGAARAIQELI